MVSAEIVVLEAQGKYCSATAQSLFGACQSDVQKDLWVGRSICINLSDQEERAQCAAETETSRSDHVQLCVEQRAGRLTACVSLGEDRYDPDFAPARTPRRS